MPKLIKPILLLSALLALSTTQANTVTDHTPWPMENTETPRMLDRSGVALEEKRPIFVFAFIHDDVPETAVSSLFKEHFLTWVKEISAVTGRRVSVEFIRDMPPYTSYSYRTADAYTGWALLAKQYRHDKNLPHTRTTKFILLTKDAMVDKDVLGVAGTGQPFGIASLLGKQIVGHELGHTFTADHDLSEVRYNGWWCETFMAAKINRLLSNCYQYSKRNREHIVSYLDNTP